MTAAAEHGVRWTSLQPAFAWGWRRLRRQRAALRSGWWLWLEQDRTLVCHIDDGRVRAMNAGAVPMSDATQCRSAIRVEAVRLGLDVADPTCTVAGWQVDAGTSEDGLSWVSVAARAAGPAVMRESAPQPVPAVQLERTA
jgi:hypothetical protein